MEMRRGRGDSEVTLSIASIHHLQKRRGQIYAPGRAGPGRAPGRAGVRNFCDDAFKVLLVIYIVNHDGYTIVSIVTIVCLAISQRMENRFKFNRDF